MFSELEKLFEEVVELAEEEDAWCQEPLAEQLEVAEDRPLANLMRKVYRIAGRHEEIP